MKLKDGEYYLGVRKDEWLDDDGSCETLEYGGYLFGGRERQLTDGIRRAYATLKILRKA